ncbi:MAG: 4-(cytidine 5'-diphospho)-2-C-methyl-D-erythritol kinase [Cyanobacteria bacterium RUI128]|nr:4-(cytidine 5'-diphospho)-2-C-methyl-D-erythritol kinase [Cyanobacteria bacterium RUI128]
MDQIIIKTPAKLNLTLEVLNKREDGFHNIQSIMQLIDLYDYITITTQESDEREIILSGTSDEIPYNEKNLAYKAAELFFGFLSSYEDSYFTEQQFRVNIHIEKNIPVAAGLAGGSTNAAGTLWGLNRIFDDVIPNSKLHELCGELGSDLNVCLEGGCLLATSRGEVIKKLPFRDYNVSLIKPVNLGISAKEAYTKYSEMENKPNYDYTHKMLDAIMIGTDLRQFLYNDLETAVFDDYEELQKIKKVYPNSIMSGSGSTYFMLNEKFEEAEGFWVKNGLRFISDGVSEA